MKLVQIYHINLMKKILILLSISFVFFGCSSNSVDRYTELMNYVDNLVKLEDTNYIGLYESRVFALVENESGIDVYYLDQYLNNFNSQIDIIKNEVETGSFNGKEEEIKTFYFNEFSPVLNEYLIASIELKDSVNKGSMTEEEFDRLFDIFDKKSTELYKYETMFLDIIFKNKYNMNFLMVE